MLSCALRKAEQAVNMQSASAHGAIPMVQRRLDCVAAVFGGFSGGGHDKSPAVLKRKFLLS